MEATRFNAGSVAGPAPMRVLVVAPTDDDILSLTEHLLTSTNADLAMVDTVADATTLAGDQDFDAIITRHGLPDGNGLELLQSEQIPSDTPVIVLDDSLDGEHVLSALRAGAMDVITRPYDLGRLNVVLRESVRQRRRRRHQAARNLRLRRLSSRMIQDRRELRKRVNLVCQDLVHAYRRLAEKVVDMSE